MNKSLDIQIILVSISVKIAVALFDFKEQNEKREILNLYEYDCLKKVTLFMYQKISH